MNRHRQSATWLGAALGTACAVLVLALGAHASDHRGRADRGVPSDLRPHGRWPG